MKNSTLKDFIQLSKLPVIIPVSFTSFTAFYVSRPEIGMEILFVSLGVLLLAAAASALNQVQEIRTDRLMLRTKNRPLPEQRIPIKTALFFIFICFLSGSILLYQFGNLPAMLLGWLNLAWYNSIYTPLKRKTAFAVIPGSITGAIPPVIGWVAAGGNMLDTTSVLMAFMFFMAQVPHFWLLILKYGEQYSEAGLPSLTAIFSRNQINRLSYIWILSSLISALILTQFGLVLQSVPKIAILIITIIIAIIFSRMNPQKSRSYNKKHFILLNSYFMIIMILLILDRSISF